MKLKMRKRIVISAMASSERLSLMIDQDVLEVLRKRYPRDLASGIRHELTAFVRKEAKQA